MWKILFLTVNLFITSAIFSQSSEIRPVIDIKGTWSFTLDAENKGVEEEYFNKSFSETVQLPGTTDTNKKGTANTNREETTHLSRLYKYEGPAWYSREVEIPEEWKGKQIMLYLERTRPTKIWVDGQLAGENNLISVSQQYDLSSLMSPGKHKLTIRVDNGESIPPQIRSSSHACTESTQTNWNGIIGRMELSALNKLHIKSMQVYPDVANHLVKVKINLSDASLLKDKTLQLVAQAFNSGTKHHVPAISYPLKKDCDSYEFVYYLGEDALPWSEFNPALYRITATIKDTDSKSIDFGLREFNTKDSQFTINGTKTFLRGKHDACVFPLTAHTPMTVEAWQHYFRTAKAYGINHCRFHSWCPPEACFKAADLEGIYLQPELPIWGTLDEKESELLTFLTNEGESIQNEYGNFASFVMFALGNELSGDEEVMKSFVEHFKAIDDRHLYAYGANNFLGFKGYLPGEDFLVTCRVGWGEGFTSHTRGSFSFADAEDGGYINYTYPNSVINFSDAITKSPIPVISHETGQFQIYPNYKEMDKYTGVLAPWNFEVFRERLDKAGMLNRADCFFKASGALSALLYKADIEMCLRTEKLGGFQLLDLQDYPGQGSAYVGILDAFMDSKDIISPEEWKQFCSEVVPLFETDKFCWTNNELLSGNVKIANYSNTNLGKYKLKWKLTIDNEIIGGNEILIPEGNGLLSLGQIQQALLAIDKASKLMLTLEIEGTPYRNTYPLWVYPTIETMKFSPEIIVTNMITEDITTKLRQGEKVLLMPELAQCEQITVGGLFQSDYWNYRMFKTICDRIEKPVSPGTLGILTDPKHPLFNNFPTDHHTNWQWFPIIKQSYPLILDQLPVEYTPIIQVIDNVERNHKLGLVFEFNVEGGKLLICMSNLEAVKDKPEVRQFYESIINYMESDSFAPTSQITVKSLKELFGSNMKMKEIERLENISYE